MIECLTTEKKVDKLHASCGPCPVDAPNCSPKSPTCTPNSPTCTPRVPRKVSKTAT